MLLIITTQQEIVFNPDFGPTPAIVVRANGQSIASLSTWPTAERIEGFAKLTQENLKPKRAVQKPKNGTADEK